MSNLVGQTIATYRIDTLLGEGGMGSVFRATDINLSRQVALKVMHPHLARLPEFQNRFVQEARSAANLNHPSIVKIYQFDARSDLMFLAMEYFPAGTLTSHIRRTQAQKQVIDLRESLAILAQVSDALDYAHRRGIVHRDIKPDNILLAHLDQPERAGEPSLRAVVTDFGLAKLRTGAVVQTQDGTFMGTLPYMSPEQCLGKELDGRSDIYAVGIMLYLMTVGRLPFDVQSPSEAILKHINEPPPPPREITPNLPEIIAVIINKCLAKKPDDRFATAADLAAALRSAAASLTEVQVTQYAPPGTVAHLITQLMPEGIEPRGQSIFAQAEAVPPSAQDRIQITTSAAESTGRIMAVGSRKSLTIGRDPDNAITIEDNRTSRKHARIDFDGKQYTITDLNSTNGTFLAGARLLPGIAETWSPEKVLQIGDSYLRLLLGERPGVATAAAIGARMAQPGPTGQTGSVPYPGGQPAPSISGRIGVLLAQSEVSIEPGQPATIAFTLLNQGSIVDHFRLALENIPTSWSITTPPTIQLMPGAQQQVSVTLQPRRIPQTRAGRYPVTVRVSSQDNPNQFVTTQLVVIIKPFFSFTTELFPQRIKSGRPVRLTVKNTGNSPQNYHIDWMDRADEVVFVPDEVTLPVAEGQAGVIEAQARPKQRKLFGGETTHNFSVRVSDPQSESQVQTGELISRALIPTWLLPILAMLCLCVAASGGLLLNGAFPGFLPFMRTSTPTVEIASLVDFDLDGLADDKELQVGTDPKLFDTDRDGVGDGAEYEKGTDPLSANGVTNTSPAPGEITPTLTITATLPAGGGDTPTPAPLSEVKIQLVQPSPGSYQPATKDLVFQVKANDPRVGANDGDGINAVSFQIYNSSGSLVFENEEMDPGYCAFSGGEPTCNILNFIREKKFWPYSDLPIEEGNHTLVAIAYAPDGSIGKLEYPFTIDLPSSKLAFVSDRDGPQDIFVYDFDTGGQTNITQSGGYEGNPAWSPDGEWIAFDVYNNVSNDIYIQNIETGVQRIIANNSSNEVTPTWSPDGEKIAYASDQNGNMDIYVANIDGSNVQQLTFDQAEEILPAWSPDGVMIAYVSYATGNGDIYLMNARGEDPSPLINSVDQESGPAWAPDSAHLAFHTLFISNSNIYWVELTNGWDLISQDTSHYDYEPEVSPDGSQVAFTSSTRSLFNAIYVMNNDGSGVFPLIQDANFSNQSPAWLP